MTVLATNLVIINMDDDAVDTSDSPQTSEDQVSDTSDADQVNDATIGVKKPDKKGSKKKIGIPTLPKSYLCDICGKVSKNYSVHYGHKQIHRTDKAYTCLVCKKSFNTCRKLWRHRISHLGTTNCEFCGKKLKDKTNYNNHVARYHPMEKKAAKKRYICSLCNKPFVQKSALNRHMRAHTDQRPHCCGECGKCFKDATCLKVHSRIHNNDKPFQCETCGKAFAQSNNLKAHVSIHTQEKPYICETCGKGFNQKSNLNTHCKRGSCTKQRTKSTKESHTAFVSNTINPRTSGRRRGNSPKVTPKL